MVVGNHRLRSGGGAIVFPTEEPIFFTLTLTLTLTLNLSAGADVYFIFFRNSWRYF
jgi:hypothetical protein